MRRVVVTGMGVVSPVGSTLDEFWNNLVGGVSVADRISYFDPSGYATQIAAEVKNFDQAKFVEKRDARKMDLFTIYAVAASKMAVEDSGLDFSKEDPAVTGVIIGSGIGGLSTWEKEHTKFVNQGPSRVSPFLIPMMISDMTSGYVSIHWGLKGPNYTTVSACASGAHAIGDAFRAIKYDDADVVVTGGAEAPITPFALAGFSNMRALSRRNDEPQRASRPFDKARDGFVMAEGAATLILEEMEFAQKRSARIYCEILGFGATGDGYHITAPAPEGEGARRSMARSIREAGCEPEAIAYINTHGTSTELNDKFEARAIKDLFDKHSGKLVLNATKSMIGHSLGAAGAVEALVTILSMRDGVVHPTLNLEDPDPECEGLDVVSGQARKLAIEYALSNSLGFGGHNVTLCLKRT